MKKFILFTFLMFSSVLNVNAEACDAYDIKRLKEIANGVEITYELQEPFNNGETVINDYYTIKVSGLTNEIFVFDEKNDEYFTVNNTSKEFVNSGKMNLVIKANGCSNILRKIYLKLPVFNSYSTTSYCEKNKNVAVCKGWVEELVSESDYLKELNSVSLKKENDFFKGYGLYIIFGVAFVLIIIILLIIKKRKEDKF